MKIHLNGDEREIVTDSTISQLLELLELRGRLAVEVNLSIIPRSEHGSHRLQDGDRVEIVHAIGGG